MRPHALQSHLLGWLVSLGTVSVSVAATLTVTVQLPDGHPLPGAVVTLHQDGVPTHPVAPVHAAMDQVDRAFAPDLLVIPVDSTVEFPNSDSVSHQIYSFSAAKRFQLPLYRGKPYRPSFSGSPVSSPSAATSMTKCSRTYWSPTRRSLAEPTRRARGPRRYHEAVTTSPSGTRGSVTTPRTLARNPDDRRVGPWKSDSPPAEDAETRPSRRQAALMGQLLGP